MWSGPACPLTEGASALLACAQARVGGSRTLALASTAAPRTTMFEPHVISPMNHPDAVGSDVTDGSGVSDGAGVRVGAAVGAHEPLRARP